MIARYVAELRKTIKNDTEKLRKKTLKNLKKIFSLTSELAGGEFKTQTEGGKIQKVTLRERRVWLQVAAKIVQIMKTATSGFDEKSINADLEELERLVKEIRRETKEEKIKE